MKITLDFNWKTALRWVLALLLIWAALSKLANLQEFYGDLLAYRLPLPQFLLRLTAITLPWLELLCGLMLAANFWAPSVLAWTVILFGAFTIATGQAWIRGLNISCGCFKLSFLGVGPDSSTALFLESVGFAFFRALLLGMGAVYLLRQQLQNSQPRIHERL